jgi:hypothetical protein
MSFLDNLEDSLKNLESRDEKDSQRDHERREEESAAARAAGPYAEQLKDGQFTKDLLVHATRMGFSKRMKVHITWLGTTLRLEARDKKLDLRPTPRGVVSVFIENGNESNPEPVDLNGDPEALVDSWFKSSAELA